MRRLPFVRSLPVGKVRYRYAACRHPVAKARWHALWRAVRTDVTRTPAEVADVVGLSAVTARAVLHRWTDDGPAGVVDRRAGKGPPRADGRPKDEWLYVSGFPGPDPGGRSPSSSRG